MSTVRVGSFFLGSASIRNGERLMTLVDRTSKLCEALNLALPTHDASPRHVHETTDLGNKCLRTTGVCPKNTADHAVRRAAADAMPRGRSARHGKLVRRICAGSRTCACGADYRRDGDDPMPTMCHSSQQLPGPP